MSRLTILTSMLGAAAVGLMAVPASALPAPAITGLTLAGNSNAQVEQVGYRGGHRAGVRFWLGSGHGRRGHHSSRRRHGGDYGGGYGRGHGSRH